jgi:hypothetical protein
MKLVTLILVVFLVVSGIVVVYLAGYLCGADDAENELSRSSGEEKQ